MSQFGKTPPWAREPTASPALGVVGGMTPQPVPGNQWVGGSGSFQQPQFAGAQTLGIANANFGGAMPQQATMLSQPGVAIPTSLASSQHGPVPAVAYPPPRPAIQQQQQQQPQPQPQPQQSPVTATPTKQRVFAGQVTKLHDNFGFVDKDVFFQTSCVKGQQPQAGDRVLVEATYNANMPFKWNATRIQVIQNQTNLLPSMLNQTCAGASGMVPNQNPMMSMPRQNAISHRQRNDREERNRNRQREDRRHLASPAMRKRSRSPRRSPIRTKSPPRRRSSRSRIRYSCNVPKISLDTNSASVITLKSRYSNLYIPSDFVISKFLWSSAFSLDKPFELGKSCPFHIMHKEVEDPMLESKPVVEPTDSNYLYSAKVMILSCPSLAELCSKSCSLAEERGLSDDKAVHPTRLINFLVGLKGKSEPMAIGGPWSELLDGPNPDKDPAVLIRTAIRTCRALTGIDLSSCTKWYRFTEICYHRPAETHRGRVIPSRVETVTIFVPDVESCCPTHLDWQALQQLYQSSLDKKVSPPDSVVCPDNQEEEEDHTGVVETCEPTHYDQLEPKSMKVCELKQELESRQLASKGLTSQLIARLTRVLKTEREEEEQKESDEVKEAEADEETEEKESVEQQENEEEKRRKELEECKRKAKERIIWEKRYALPSTPAMIVHPSSKAKGGKFDCTMMSLSVLLDYRPEDNKEHTFEISLFAELFNEMLMRDFGFSIYQSVQLVPETSVDDKAEESKKEEVKKEDGKDDKDDASIVKKRKTDRSSKDDDGSSSEDEDAKTVQLTTINKPLLLAFVYFDLSHTGFILERDLEDIILTLGLQHTRAQLRKLIARVSSKEKIEYRKLCEAPIEKDNTNASSLPAVNTLIATPDQAKIFALGNKEALQVDREFDADDAGTNGNGNCSNIVTHDGALIDIPNVLERLDSSERARLTLEGNLRLLESKAQEFQNVIATSEETIKKVCSELSECKKKAREQKRHIDQADQKLKRITSVATSSSSMLKKVLGDLSDICEVSVGEQGEEK